MRANLYFSILCLAMLAMAGVTSASTWNIEAESLTVSGRMMTSGSSVLSLPCVAEGLPYVPLDSGYIALPLPVALHGGRVTLDSVRVLATADSSADTVRLWSVLACSLTVRDTLGTAFDTLTAESVWITIPCGSTLPTDHALTLRCDGVTGESSRRRLHQVLLYVRYNR